MSDSDIDTNRGDDDIIINFESKRLIKSKQYRFFDGRTGQLGI